MSCGQPGGRRDHGGDIDVARARFGAGDWIDLSTGINRRPWPVGPLPDHAWQALPTAAAEARLIAAAAGWLGCDPARLLPMAGASAAIQLIPRLLAPGRAAVIAPSYNEHAASLRAAGWQVHQVPDIAEMAGADLAVVVNPNNPDGREWQPEALARLAGTVGQLVVDESFADPRPDLSLARQAPDNTLILRSFGKFWGLAGLRLGFVIAAPALRDALAQAAGPWAVSGPALEIGARAMADRDWADDAVLYHSEASLRLDRLALAAGWRAAGGTHLFRLYDTPDATAAQEALARAHIWTRRFPYSATWLRLGIPGSHDEWDRLKAALRPSHSSKNTSG
ncbi:threonine-phosphate decarboxylase CobD [Paracoccus siganidrum]|uniref:threonine-phosphate decarboxylase n=1 Tax=Paracoccus siganidrum TaxID=1276757 RepID=A0A419A2J4_9RHOB|nr:threonine-phosphate decarboxylase CobD [Paracoccus siganidrum]RJL07265.1 threonine-phosphate decarboxylase [Paracoccus siganidrum]RMC39393.1 threonine-phosphate decarboxylase [Paracoccus siganidrum]